MAAGVRLGQLTAGVLCAACVVGSPRRPTQAEAAGGPPPPPTEEKSAGQLLQPLPAKGGTPDAPGEPRAGQVWVAGYWHWNGVSYEWIGGHWEDPPDAAPR